MDLTPIRREVDADNSCLFSAIAYLINRDTFNETSSLKMRQLIVNHLIEGKFPESLLDIPKNEYIEYIINPKNWGGALEIKMFSDIFNVQITAFDIKTGRADIYGEDKGYKQRIYIIYNGIHYDPLVLNCDYSSDPETDQTIFDSNNKEIFELFKSITEEYKYRGDFVEFYSLRCIDCKLKCKNQEEAMEHMLNYQHQNFEQI